MRRKAPELPPASDLLIAADGVNRNTVMRVGALSEVQAKKLPWVEAIAAELIPAKANSHNELVTLVKSTEAVGNFASQRKRDRFRLPTPHWARDNCDSTNGVTTKHPPADRGATWVWRNLNPYRSTKTAHKCRFDPLGLRQELALS